MHAKQAWIVIELDPSLKWRYPVGLPGITTKESHGGDNVYLRHVKKVNGQPVVQVVTPDDGDLYTLAYYGVDYRDAYKSQFINVHVELQQADDDWVEITIDPDVPNTGADIPFTRRRRRDAEQAAEAQGGAEPNRPVRSNGDSSASVKEADAGENK